MLTPSAKKLAASISIASVALLTVAVILAMLVEQRRSVLDNPRSNRNPSLI